ncbi:MAG: DnaJ domain-containing protein [Brevinematales bacterium]|jgi:curved DNA-binding protein CbpA
MKTYYDILGIQRTANIKSIKAAYRILVKKYHPDIVKTASKDGRVFEDITAAYNTLIHPDKRKAYDSRLDGLPSALAALTFPFREFRNWVKSFPLYKIIFSGKPVSNPAGIDPVPAATSLPVEELLQRIIYSKNLLLQIHSVRALLAKESHYAEQDLLRLLYTGINEAVKIEIVKGLKNPRKSGTDRIMREIFKLEKSEAVRSAIKARL